MPCHELIRGSLGIHIRLLPESVNGVGCTVFVPGNGAQMKSELDRLTDELATGRIADIPKAVSGDFTSLASIEHGLSTLKSVRLSTMEAADYAESLQDVLGQAQAISDDLAPALLTAGSSGNATMLVNTAADAEQKFLALVSAFNTRLCERSLLSGTATERQPLAGGQAILADLQAATAGQTTASGIESAINAWFDTPGGGFDTMAYQGSLSSLAPFRIGNGEEVVLDSKANDPAIRELMKGFAIAAHAGNAAIANKPEEQRIMMQHAGVRILSAQYGISKMRAGIGAAEARIEAAMTRNSAKETSLEIARNNIISADPYKTAGDLEAVRGNLEMLYTITARLSRLSLVNYLK